MRTPFGASGRGWADIILDLKGAMPGGVAPFYFVHLCYLACVVWGFFVFFGQALYDVKECGLWGF